MLRTLNTLILYIQILDNKKPFLIPLCFKSMKIRDYLILNKIYLKSVLGQYYISKKSE